MGAKRDRNDLGEATTAQEKKKIKHFSYYVALPGNTEELEGFARL